MKIEGVVISCYRLDFALTRLCVSSIRFWYPDIPIWLLKDRQSGDFNTQEMERYWNVQIYPTQQRNQGWGFGKLEVMTALPARRLLFLDSDITFVGPVIDRLEQFDHDFIVDREDFTAPEIEVQFFSPDKLKAIDPGFNFPGYGFNGGQIVATTGRITKADFDGLLDWSTRRVVHAEIFRKGDQGLTNYVVLRKAQAAGLSIHREPFMIWPARTESSKHIQVQQLTAQSPHQQLIHWAGLGWGNSLDGMPRHDILLHFENLYYSRIPRGGVVRKWREARHRADRRVIMPLKSTLNQMLRRFSQPLSS